MYQNVVTYMLCIAGNFTSPKWSVIWIKCSNLARLARLLLDFLKVHFNNFPAWLGGFAVCSQLRRSKIKWKIKLDRLVTKQSHSRTTSGFLFLKMYEATCESQTFVVILFNAYIFLILLRQLDRVFRCYREWHFLHFNFEKNVAQFNVLVRCWYIIH